MLRMDNLAVVDIFCGVGGLTHGFILEGFNVIAGYDVDEESRYPYVHNNHAAFINKKVEDVSAEEIIGLYPKGSIKILVGCAPCQPYSSYTKKVKDKNEKWKLVPIFADLICSVNPDIVTMENVPQLTNFDEGKVLKDFVDKLTKNGYFVSKYPNVHCPGYGIPQDRTRLVVFASKLGPIAIEEPTLSPGQYRTVKQTIEHLEPLGAGQTSLNDPIHKASGLSEINLQRIRASKPGGSWSDWDEELVAACHKKNSGTSYASVYGRMAWNEPSPTITTECHGYGNGRFGHPEQDRAISLREAALLQTFPESYAFVEPGKPVTFEGIGRLIGNAVPVDLAKVIARSIRRHLVEHGKST